MKKIIIILFVSICFVVDGYSQEVMEYATVSTNANVRKKAFITFADKSEVFEATETKAVTTKDLMRILNELSLSGWKVNTTYANQLGVVYLLERKKP